MSTQDLRHWLRRVARDNELKCIRGASCDLEMASITDLAYQRGRQPVPALLFDDIPGYPGHRILFGMLSSLRRIARALHLPVKACSTPVGLVRTWKDMARELKLTPPKLVASSPLLDNILTGPRVDLTLFPSPRIHEHDGGRYFATDHAVITRDPDSGWVNLGTYRCMFVDRQRLALHMLEDQHGWLIRQKYLARREPMPVAIAIGMVPCLHFAAGTRIPEKVSEYDFAGGILAEPVIVIEGRHTGLPLPASAEIVIEGECLPGETTDEGPFGEWHGYYANRGLEPAPEPVVRVRAIYHRNGPILTCSSPGIPPNTNSLLFSIGRAAGIWNALDRAGIPGIKGVWAPEELGSLLFTVVSIEQKYAGHSLETGRIASDASRGSARYIVIVDDDIDPANITQVMWAVATRTEPHKSITILRDCPGTSADPAIPLSAKKEGRPLRTSRAIINACRPYSKKSEWYPLAKSSAALERRTFRKWRALLEELLRVR